MFRGTLYFYCKTCTLLFFEVYIIVSLYTFMLSLVGVSSEFSVQVWELGDSLDLPLDFCECALCVVW